MQHSFARLQCSLYCLILLSAILTFILPAPAKAHRSGLFATGSGATILGQASLAGGEAPDGILIKIYAPDKRLLGTATTDHHGAFSFQALEQTDHILILDTADGHRATFTVPEEQLLITPPALNLAAPQTGIETDMRQAIAEQIAPLRQDIRRLEERMRLQDILGGIGYIAGIFGVLLYLRSRQSR